MADVPVGRTAVILDEHPLWRDAVEQVLGRIGIETLAKVTTAGEALEVVSRQQPDLLVLDTDTNGGVPDAFGGLREICSSLPSIKAVVISRSDDPQEIESAFAAGAVAYVLKRAEPDDLASAMRQVFQRSLYLASDQPAARTAEPSTETVGLTRREREILLLIAEGRTNKQVAKMLWVTEQTVKFHLANIFRKLDVSNRTQASRWAYAHGLLASTEPPEAEAATLRAAAG